MSYIYVLFCSVLRDPGCAGTLVPWGTANMFSMLFRNKHTIEILLIKLQIIYAKDMKILLIIIYVSNF
jgi:predicted class III extradiol MEMO1 family dioxygenase